MIPIQAKLTNEGGGQRIQLTTIGKTHEINIPTKENGKGSKANGGETLFLALAVCYCNDIYREAAATGIEVEGVEVEVSGEFAPEPGAVAEKVTYSARVKARASEEEIHKLMRHTDTVAEIHNTLRKGVSVEIAKFEAISIDG